MNFKVLGGLVLLVCLVNLADGTIISESTERFCTIEGSIANCNDIVYPVAKWVFDEDDQTWKNLTDITSVSSNATASYLRVPAGRDENGTRLWREIKLAFPNAIWTNRLREWKQEFRVTVPAGNSSVARNISGFRNWFNVTAISETAFVISREGGRRTFKYIFDYADIRFCQGTIPDTFSSKAIITQLDEDTVEVRIWYNNTQLQQVRCDPSISVSAQDDLTIGDTIAPPDQEAILKFLISLPSDANVSNSALYVRKVSNGTEFRTGNVSLYNASVYPNGTAIDWTESITPNSLVQILSFANNTQNYTLIQEANQYYSWNATNATLHAWKNNLNLTLLLANSTIILANCLFGSCTTTNNENLVIDFGSAISDDRSATFNSSEAGGGNPYLNISFSSDANVSFVSCTPANGSALTVNYICVNVSSTYGGDIHSVINDWNNSLVGWWDFDFYNSTTIYDNSTYAHNTSFWFQLSTSNITSGIRGQAIALAGNNTAMFVNNTPTLQNTNVTGFSAFAWVNGRGQCISNNATTVSTFCTIFAKSNQTTSTISQGWVLAMQATNYRFQVLNGMNTSATLDTTFGSVTNDTWTHVGITFDGSTIRKYVNGIEFASNSLSGGFNDSETAFSIGMRNPESAKYFSNQNFFNGSIDEVILYNRALSYAEVNATFNAQAYQYLQNFTSLKNGNYQSRAWSITPSGNFNSTELREWTLTNNAPNISFVAPTPANGTLLSSTNNSIYVNVSSADSDSSEHSTYLDWNNSLVAWWSFDFFNKTVVFDNSSNALNLTWNGNNPNFTGQAKRGLGLNFTSTASQFLQPASQSPTIPSIFNLSNNMTWAFWFKGNTGRLFSRSEGANKNRYMLLVGTNVLQMYLEKDGMVYNFSVTSTGINDGSTWTHVVINFVNDSGYNIYLNGSNKTYTGVLNFGTIPSTSVNQFYLGRIVGSTGYFNGTLDEFLYFNRTLTPQEINASYNAKAYQYERNFSELANGDYYFKGYSIDAEGRVNTTETRIVNISTPPNSAPQFWWHSLNFTNGSEYGFPKTIRVFANWSDDNGILSVIMTFNNSNYTMTAYNGTSTNGVWNVNVSSFGAGTYYYNFTASDGVLANTSDTFSLVIAKNSTYAFTHLLNGSSSVVGFYPTTVRATCVYSEITDSPLVDNFLSEYRNNTLVQNQDPIDYSETPTVGDYNFTCSNNGTANFSGRSDTKFANISLGFLNLTLHLNGTFNNKTYTFPEMVNASGWANNASFITPVVSLLEDGVTIAVGTQATSVNVSRAVGIYNFTVFYAGNVNYSSASKTFFATINKGVLPFSLSLNNTDGDRTYSLGTTVNATTNKTVSESNLTLYKNGSVLGSAQFFFSNDYTTAELYSWNYTSCSAESQNYSASCLTRMAFVTLAGAVSGEGVCTKQVQIIVEDDDYSLVVSNTDLAMVGITFAILMFFVVFLFTRKRVVNE